jgi:ActR/RegA family two-component response regulator
MDAERVSEPPEIAVPTGGLGPRSPSPAEVLRTALAIDTIARALSPGTPPADGVMPLQRVRVLYAQAVITFCGGNRTRAAKALDMDRRALYRLLEQEAG